MPVVVQRGIIYVNEIYEYVCCMGGVVILYGGAVLFFPSHFLDLKEKKS